jgi:5-methylcytosine-specific restriction endonuclease McrA
MKSVVIYPVLVLLSDYTPFRVVDWKRAFIWLANDKTEIVESSDYEVHSPNKTWKVPSVIRISSTLSSRVKVVRFSRYGVWARDKSRCQYCGEITMRKDFTLDHVIPRSHNGATTWNNVVTCCFPCNQKKGSRPLLESGMSLKNGMPSKPSFRNLIEREILRMGFVPDLWKNYLPDSYHDILR